MGRGRREHPRGQRWGRQERAPDTGPPGRAHHPALREGKLDGLRIGFGFGVGFGGDLPHGRTVRSLSLALSHFDDITLLWATEDFLGMPEDLAELLAARGVRVQREGSVRDVMRQVDFYYMTRPQLERMPGVTQKDVVSMMTQYRSDLEKVEGFPARVLHPLPVNSEIAEVDYRVYLTPAQAFFTQAELGTGNNRCARTIHGTKQSGIYIDKIHDGTVIDHLVPGTLRAVSDILDLENRGYSCTTATIDYVKDGGMAEKLVYLLCANTNCISRTANEDVPPRFYNDAGTIRCRCCRRPYTVAHRKVTDPEKAAFLQKLPPRIEPVAYPD